MSCSFPPLFEEKKGHFHTHSCCPPFWYLYHQSNSTGRYYEKSYFAPRECNRWIKTYHRSPEHGDLLTPLRTTLRTTTHVRVRRGVQCPEFFFVPLSPCGYIFFPLPSKTSKKIPPTTSREGVFPFSPFRTQMRGREKPCFYPQLLINKPPLFQEIISYHILEEGGSMPRTFFTTLSLPPHPKNIFFFVQHDIYSVRHVFFTSRYDIIT